MPDEAPFTMDVFNAAEVGHIWYVNDPPHSHRRHPEGYWAMEKTGLDSLGMTSLRSGRSQPIQWHYRANQICKVARPGRNFTYLTAFEAVFDDDDLWE